MEKKKKEDERHKRCNWIYRRCVHTVAQRKRKVNPPMPLV
jgi:hypothetical protein